MSDTFQKGEIKKAIENKDASVLLSMLSDQDKKLLDSLLSNEKEREAFLSSKDAKTIISNLFKGR